MEDPIPQNELDQYHEYTTRPYNRFIEGVSQYIGELPSIIAYGQHYFASVLDSQTRSRNDRFIAKPLIKLKEMMTFFGWIFVIGSGLALFFSKSLLLPIMTLLAGVLCIKRAEITENPVIAIANGPDQDTISYVTSSRTAKSRKTLEAFKKLFHLEKIRTADILFFVSSKTGRHAFEASSLKKYLIEDRFIWRTFHCAWKTYDRLFKEWSSDKNPRSVALYINRANLSILASSILGFDSVNEDLLDFIDEMEDTLLVKMPYWEIFGWKLALFPSQRGFLATREKFSRVSQEIFTRNRQAILRDRENFTYDLAKQVAYITGGPSSRVEDYLDSVEVRHGTLAVLLTAGNPAVVTIATMYLLQQHPEATKRLLENISRLHQDADLISDETERIRFYYDKVKSCSGLDYLSNYFKECLRYIAPGNTIPRYYHEPITLNGQRIPGGSLVITNLRSQCRDAGHWNSPEKFNPDRFITDKKNIHSYPFVPFSTGERRCPGFMTAKMMFFAFLLTFAGKYQLIEDITRPKFILPDERVIIRISRIHRATLINNS